MQKIELLSERTEILFSIDLYLDSVKLKTRPNHNEIKKTPWTLTERLCFLNAANIVCMYIDVDP